MNTYTVSFEILFNNALIGKGVDTRQASSLKNALIAIQEEQGSALIDQINEQQVKKGEKPFTLKNVLIFPLFAYKEK